MALKQIKGKIRSIDKTHKVTRAMEAVSAVKMRKAQATALMGRPYARAAMTILSRVAGAGEISRHPLSHVRSVKKVLYIVVTSDKGLAGSLNSAILREAARVVTASGLSKDDLSFVTLGRKAGDYFEKRGFRVLQKFENIADDASAEDMYAITALVRESFLKEEADEVVAIYTNFLSTLTQEPVVRKLLPLSSKTLSEIVEGIVPEKGRFANLTKKDRKEASSYQIEPSEEEVLSAVLPLLLNVAIYHGLLESKASEHSARMVAMKNASEKAKEISEELTHDLNKERQALITREVSEIIGGIEAMSK